VEKVVHCSLSAFRGPSLPRHVSKEVRIFHPLDLFLLVPCTAAEGRESIAHFESGPLMDSDSPRSSLGRGPGVKHFTSSQVGHASVI